MRARAISCALWYGIRPWRMYERTCHYAPMTYREHLRTNLRLALRWLARRETRDDAQFEISANHTQVTTTVTPEEWRYRTQLAGAVFESDYDVAHGNAVTGAQLDWLEAHDYPMPVSIAASGMVDRDITSLRLAFVCPAPHVPAGTAGTS